MTVAICQSMVTPFLVENTSSSPTPVSSWLSTLSPEGNSSSAVPSYVNSWSKIQSQIPAAVVSYIHPLVQRSKALMSVKSLEMCTETLGSETGSNYFDHQWFTMLSPSLSEEKTVRKECFSKVINGRGELLPSVNYHSTERRSPPRSFPPPLSSISRRDGPCFRMQPHRCNGQLIIEAIAVPSRNYLHAHRHEGRLVLSFVEATSSHQSNSSCIASNEPLAQNEDENFETQDKKFQEENTEDAEEVDDEEDDEEEVEVVDRGTVVEVKVSRKPPQLKGSEKILRSSILINKFVIGGPLSINNRLVEPRIMSPERRIVPTTTTSAVAALAASSVSELTEVAGHSFPLTENKLFFTTKRRNWEEMLYNMRRCSELRRPLFFWEPCCIAAS